MKRVLIVVIVLLALTSVAYAAQPHFRLEIDMPESIFFDEILQANISVKDYVYGKEKPTSAIDFSVLYDSERFEFIGFTSKDGTYISVQESVYENVYGNESKNQRILVGMIGSVNAITEDMEFMTLNFRPKSEFHEALFTLHSAKASTSTGELFFPEVSYKKVAIANIYDVNRDGFIDVRDLAIISYNMGNDPIEHYYADINRDGAIDTTDIDIIMNYIFNNWR